MRKCWRKKRERETFFGNDMQTLVSYAHIKKKAVVLLSTLNSKNKIEEDIASLVMKLDYNAKNTGIENVYQAHRKN